jgi:hypothetical protein
LENRIALRAVCPAPSGGPALLKRGIELGGKQFASFPTIDRLVPSAFRWIGLYKSAVHNDHGFFYRFWHVRLRENRSVCCAFAASGHVAAPPTIAMNFRRLS